MQTNAYSQAIIIWTYSFEVEIATDKLKRYKSPGTKLILSDLEQAGGITLHS